MSGASQQLHQLRVILSCRKITAQVTNTLTKSIIALASTTEPEFVQLIKVRQSHVPRHRNLIDPGMASRIGEKLGMRLREVGVLDVEIDSEEEMSRPIHNQKMVTPLFRAVKEAGIRISGAEKLVFGG